MTNTKSQDRDRPAAEAAASVLPQGSFGAWLRTQREARGVGLRDIADSSKISVRYLEALEQDRFEILPAPVFTRGFLREYARVVGLDPDEVVNLYLLASRDGEEEGESDEPRPNRGPGGPSPLVYAALLVLAVAIFLGLAALVWSWARSRGSEADAPAPIGTSRPELPQPDASEPPLRSPAVVEIPAPAEPPAPSSAGTSAALRVQLEFTEDCWVELVVDGKGRTGELRTSGEVVTVEAERFVLLTLGNVAAARVEVDGKPLVLPGEGNRVIHDFRIDRQTVASADGADSGT